MIKALNTWADLAKAGFREIGSAGKPEDFEAIGRFVLAVSNEIDGRLNACLQWQIASGEEAVTRIVVGEMRIGDITASLTRIANSRALEPLALRNMSALFSEIAILRHVRDVALHRACLANGDKLAFHNAFLAKTDSAIEVDIYTRAELNEFAGYAKRLGCRVTRLLEVLYPNPQSLRTQAFLTITGHTVLIAAAIALVKSGTISKEKIARIRALEKTSNKAIRAHVDAVMQADENFSKLQQAATAETGKFVAALGTIEAATDLKLHEIPTRLRKKDRVSRKDVPRSRVRPVRSSGT